MEVFEGNPIGKWVWANVWKLPLFKLGAPGQSPTLFGDSANIFRTNIEQASASVTTSARCLLDSLTLSLTAVYLPAACCGEFHT